MNDKDEFAVQDAAEMEEIYDFDFQRVMMLLSIMEKQVLVAPKATSLFGIAQAELDELNADAKDIARRRADRVREMEQRRYAAEAERRASEQAEAEAQSAEQAKAAELKPTPTPAPVPGPGEPSPARRL